MKLFIDPNERTLAISTVKNARIIQNKYEDTQEVIAKYNVLLLDKNGELTTYNGVFPRLELTAITYFANGQMQELSQKSITLRDSFGSSIREKVIIDADSLNKIIELVTPELNKFKAVLSE